MKNWTPAQSAAINTFGRDLLVSAAAGSGKTAALTERIIVALTRDENPTDITRILAVTFTRASAAELRRRISDALTEKIAKEPENRRLVRQLMLLGSAKICTIDSFCSDVVKSNFERLPIPSGFRIPDDTELKLLKTSVMEDVIDRRFADGNMAFANLADSVCANKDDTSLSKILCKTYEKLINLPEGVDFLKSCAHRLDAEAAGNYLESRAARLIMGELREKLKYYIDVLTSACDELAENEKTLKNYYPAFKADLEFCLSLTGAIAEGDYTSARRVAQSYSPRNLTALRGDAKTPRTEMLKELRSIIKDELKETAGKYFGQSEEEIHNCFIVSAEMTRELYETISQFENSLIQEKQNRSICDFDDIRRFAFGLLTDPDGKPTDIAREYASRFDEIFIDEYQDVTEVQDLLFRAVSNGHNRFMVGDIKQSIYGFRGAEPSLFSDYRAKFPQLDSNVDDDSGRTIFMSDNFRCDENVIKFVNLICPRIFRACGESVGYVDEDDLVFSKLTAKGYSSSKVNVTLIKKAESTGGIAEKVAEDATDNSSSDVESEDAPEIAYISSEISRLLAVENRADGNPIRPGDIAVICRAKSTCAEVTEALKRLGIPVESDSERGYFKRPEVMLMISLLAVIDNPQKDIPLAAVLCSPIFGFTMDDLSQIRSKAKKSASLYDAVMQSAGAQNKKCQSFISKLDSYRSMARSLPADKLVRGLYRDTSVLAFASDDAARADLIRLYEYTRQFEAGSFKGLYNFIKYVNQAIAGGDDGGTPPVEPGGDSVTVITIHHSKGLEFPVCFVCGCGKKFSTEDTKKALIFDNKLGPGMRINDSTGLAKINTPLRAAAAQRILRIQVEEEMRLLYVAMTRARERLYVTAQCLRELKSKLISTEIQRAFPSSYPILHAKCYLDWILPAISFEPGDNESYRFTEIDTQSIPEPVKYAGRTETSAAISITDPDDFRRELEERFSFVYPYEHLTHIPAKLSVSKLYPGILDDEEEDITPTESDLRLLSDSTFTPDFLTGISNNHITSAERGTATHVFLQFCDFENCIKNGIESEIARLSEKKFIPSRIAGIIDIEQLRRFFISDFFSSLSSAKKVFREQRFNIMLPASEFSEIPENAAALSGEKLLVQGVIDLFFFDEEDRLILCDYKTDHLSRAEIDDISLAAEKLIGRHKTQLTYYAAALERICGRTPDRVVIYSLPLGSTIDVPVERL